MYFLLLEEAYEQIKAAPYKAKSVTAQKYADMMGISVKTLYRRMAEKYGPKRERKKKSVQIDDKYIDEIAKIKAESLSYGQKSRELKTEDAIELAEKRGIVPAGLLSSSTVNRRLRSNGFRDEKPVCRYLEEFCNQSHYVDFSRSEYISISGYEDGRYILKLNGKSLRYKNKEGKAFSLWLAGMRDGKSGLRHVRYYTVTGENVFMGLDFLQWCWFREEDNHPLRYLPKYLRIDNGPLSKKKEVQTVLDALQIEARPSLPYNKNAMGKIERPWRTFWQNFELYLLMELGHGAVISLDDLNDRAFEYTLLEMEKPHAFYRDRKRRVMYEQDMIAYEQRTADVELTNLASWPMRRKVGRDLTFSVDNVYYKAPDRYMERWVLVHRNLDGDMVAEGEHDGLHFEVSEFEPQRFDDFRSFKDTYQEKMLKEVKQEKAKEADENGIVKLQPKKQVLKPQTLSDKLNENQIFSQSQAKIYIANQLQLDSYEEVSQYFDRLLEHKTDKESIDVVLEILQRKAN